MTLALPTPTKPISASYNGLEGGRLPLILEMTLYPAAQEALTNVLKHAQTRSISVMLERRGDEVVAIVEDDGRGFDPDAALAEGERPRLGLRGMRERVAQVDGTLETKAYATVGPGGPRAPPASAGRGGR